MIIKDNNFGRVSNEAILVSDLSDSIISGNLIRDIGTWTPSKSAITLKGVCLRNTISSNKIINTHAEHYAVYGIKEEDNCDYNYIHDNYYYQMFLGGVDKVGENTIVRNDVEIGTVGS